MFIPSFGSGGFPGTGMIGASGFPSTSGSGGDIPEPTPLAMCVPFLDIVPWLPSYSATLNIVQLPMEIGNRAIANVPQTKTVNASTGRFLFDAVPQGAKIAVKCDPAGWDFTFLVPNTDYFSLATATPL